MLIIHR